MSRHPKRIVVNGIFTFGLMVGVSVGDTTLGTLVANLGYDGVVMPSPVFIGDTLHAETTILEKRESKSRPNAGIVTFVHQRRISIETLRNHRDNDIIVWLNHTIDVLVGIEFFLRDSARASQQLQFGSKRDDFLARLSAAGVRITVAHDDDFIPPTMRDWPGWCKQQVLRLHLQGALATGPGLGGLEGAGHGGSQLEAHRNLSAAGDA